MKKLKVKINGVKYKYEITENKTIRVDGIVSADIYTTIEERAIKKGYEINPSIHYKERHPENEEPKSTVIKIHYDEAYLERRYKEWSNVELRLYKEELEEKLKNNTLTPEEKLVVQPVREEILRRSKETKN